MAQATTGPVRLRLIALPVEHGGWGFLGAPVVLGLWVAPSIAGVWLGLAALGAFLVRQPLKLALGDRQRGKRYPRTVWAERFVALYGVVALITFVIAWLTTAHPFWFPLLLAAPFAIVQLRYDLLKQSRSPLAEICGANALGALAPAIALCGGWRMIPALLLWFLLALKATSAIIYVRARIRLARGISAARVPVYLTHAVALALVVGLAAVDLVPWLSGAAFGVLLLRAVLGLLPRSLETPTPVVGVQDLGMSLLTVTCIAVGFLMGW
ncbi:MAG: YwiC-like family protein [Roseiflexus sp.]